MSLILDGSSWCQLTTTSRVQNPVGGGGGTMVVKRYSKIPYLFVFIATTSQFIFKYVLHFDGTALYINQDLILPKMIHLIQAQKNSFHFVMKWWPHHSTSCEVLTIWNTNNYFLFLFISFGLITRHEYIHSTGPILSIQTRDLLKTTEIEINSLNSTDTKGRNLWQNGASSTK